jgi:hypothetical protein
MGPADEAVKAKPSIPGCVAMNAQIGDHLGEQPRRLPRLEKRAQRLPRMTSATIRRRISAEAEHLFHIALTGTLH